MNARRLAVLLASVVSVMVTAAAVAYGDNAERFQADGMSESSTAINPVNDGGTHALKFTDIGPVSTGAHTIYVKCMGAANTAFNDGDCTNSRAAFLDDEVALTYEPPPNDCTIEVQPGEDMIPEAATAGSVVCLHEGVYTASDNYFTFSTPVTVKSYPGELAEIRASIWTQSPSADGFVLGDEGSEWPGGDGLRIDLSYGDQKPFTPDNCPLCTDQVNTTPIHWEANGGGIYANNISNRDPWGDTARAGTGILMASPSTNVTIMGNYLHQCGQLPRNNHEHCIYNSNMDGGAITDNLIYDSADRGIQNASDPNGVTETGNLVVDTHDTGINLGATASNNAISHNVVVFSDDLNFDTAPDYTDTGNSFTDNCSYQSDGTSGIGSTGNVTLANNVTADPQLTTDWAAGTATVGNSTCAAKLPAGSRFAP